MIHINTFSVLRKKQKFQFENIDMIRKNFVSSRERKITVKYHSRFMMSNIYIFIRVAPFKNPCYQKLFALIFQNFSIPSDLCGGTSVA